MAETTLWGSYAFLGVLIVVWGIIYTYGPGILISSLIRYVIAKKPLTKAWALIAVIIMYIVQFSVSVSLGSTSRSHFGLLIAAWVSYSILTRPSRIRPQVATEESTHA